MTLSEWMTENGLDDAAAAERFGINRTTVLRLRKGEQMPSHDTVRRVFEATDGQVSPNTWYGLPTSGEAA